jgi:DHA1 family tetracycline resistance protein-like MFS transporter
MRLPIVFILITLVIDAMGIGLIMPVMPTLLEDVTGGTLDQAAIWGGVLTFSFAIMQFLFGPTLGNLSDRFGRKPVLMVSLAVMMADYLVMGLAGSIWLLLVARAIGGVTAATQSTAAAYMADISQPHEKAANFGLASAAFGVGFVLGPILGGLLGQFGPRAPFFAAAALAGLNVVFGAFVLRESVTEDIRRPFDWRRANPLGSLKAISHLPGQKALLAMFFIYEFAFVVYPVIWSYFTTARFGWDSRMIGVSLASFGISMALVQGFLIKPIMRYLGEVKTVYYGFAFNFMAFLALFLVRDGTLALILTPLTALGAVVVPAIQGIMSRTAQANQQGELQGVISSARALAMILSPLAMTQIFAAFTQEGSAFFNPGAPFALSMILMIVCAGAFALYRRNTPHT